jgi:hypothetical protein
MTTSPKKGPGITCLEELTSLDKHGVWLGVLLFGHPFPFSFLYGNHPPGEENSRVKTSASSVVLNSSLKVKLI